MDTVKNIAPIRCKGATSVPDAAQPSLGSQGGPRRHVRVVHGPGSTPARPTPAMVVAAEEVTVLRNVRRAMEMGGRNAHDAVVVAIALEHFLRKAKPVRRGQAVVFQNDAFRLSLEQPIEGAAHRSAASKVLRTKECLYLAGPVHRSCDGPNLFAPLRLAQPVCSRAVRGYVQTRRPCGAYG